MAEIFDTTAEEIKKKKLLITEISVFQGTIEIIGKSKNVVHMI